jgi:hypothetical protein
VAIAITMCYYKNINLKNSIKKNIDEKIETKEEIKENNSILL